MGMPASMLGDLHVCPMITGVVPHVGGAVTGPGASTVFTCGMPAIIAGDKMVCTGPIDSLLLGSPTVFACGKGMGRVGAGGSDGFHWSVKDGRGKTRPIHSTRARRPFSVCDRAT